jgi:hypothetical protein
MLRQTAISLVCDNCSARQDYAQRRALRIEGVILGLRLHIIKGGPLDRAGAPPAIPNLSAVCRNRSDPEAPYARKTDLGPESRQC